MGLTEKMSKIIIGEMWAQPKNASSLISSKNTNGGDFNPKL